MTFLEHALALAAAGFHVFPLIEGGKFPAIDDFPNQASRDAARIRAWWTDPVMETLQPWNIGISTSHYADAGALLVVDVDNKNGKSGDDTILELETQGYEFPLTYEQRTPTGGRHLVYFVEAPVKQGTNVFGSGLDVRSRGGFIVGLGSAIGEKLYEGNSLGIVPAPQWMVDKCGLAPETRPADAGPAEGVDRERALRRALSYLTTEAPLGYAGGRNDTAFRVAARLKDFGVPQSDALDLMALHWPCEPMLEHAELEHVVNSAFVYGRGKAGNAAPETEFSVVSQPPVDAADPGAVPPEVKHPFEQLNANYAFVIAGGGHHILFETFDPEGNPALEHLGEGTFHRKHAARVMQLGKKAEPVTQLWMQSPERRSYDGICFRPGQEAPPRWYNLWRGFAVEPSDSGNAEAQWALAAWKEHLLENVCHGNEKLARWLTGYFAHIVQRPYEKPLVALVLRGGKGTGKNALIQVGVDAVLGSHSLVVADRRYLVGNFNGHLENLLLLTFDEAFWSGDKQAEGVLKSLITGDSHVIEHKGKEPYTVENKVRVVIIGNEDWLVPASHDERRFAVFDVGDGRKQDRAFFTRMRLGMEAGGCAMLLHFLLSFDLTGLDINEAPNTAALMEQKHATLEPFYQWWLDCLSEGYIIGSDFGESWPKEAGKEHFRQAFRRYIKERNIRSRIPDDRAVGKLLKKCAPSVATKGKSRTLGNIYRFTSLEKTREEWERFIGHSVEW